MVRSYHLRDNDWITAIGIRSTNEPLQCIKCMRGKEAEFTQLMLTCPLLIHSFILLLALPCQKCYPVQTKYQTTLCHHNKMQRLQPAASRQTCSKSAMETAASYGKYEDDWYVQHYADMNKSGKLELCQNQRLYSILPCGTLSLGNLLYTPVFNFTVTQCTMRKWMVFLGGFPAKYLPSYIVGMVKADYFEKWLTFYETHYRLWHHHYFLQIQGIAPRWSAYWSQCSVLV